MTPRWIVGIDGSAPSVDALRWAARHAASRGAELTALGAFTVPAVMALYVAKRGMGVDEIGIRATTAHEIDVALDQVADEVEPGQVMVQPVVVEGEASHALVDAARDADLLVVGRSGSGGLRDHLFGSVSRYCTTHASKPVVVVPPGWSSPPAERIVVGFDGSAHATQAVQWALAFADGRASVKVVAAIDVAPWLDPGLTLERFPDEVAEQERQITAALDTIDPEGRAERTVKLHSARQSLSEAATAADLLVVGARGSGAAMAGVLGSVSAWLLHDASIPIVVVPREEVS